MEEQDLARMNRVLRHRLRNLASGIKSSITFLGQELEDRLKPEEREYFPLFLDACDSIKLLTDRLSLLFDDPPTGNATHLGLLLDRVQTRIHARFPTSTIKITDECPLELELPTDVPLAIALEEVLVNAVEAAPHGEVLCDFRQSGDELKCLIYDKGEAVLDDQVSDFFLPFFTTRTQHLGVGLPIARKMIAAADGVLIATADESGGLVVEIAIPLSPVEKI